MIPSFTCFSSELPFLGTQLAFVGSFGYIELLFIGVVVLVLFGPRKLPEVFRQFGSIMTQLRSASREFKMQVMDVENQIKQEVREIEQTIEKEAKALENDIEDGEFTMDDEHTGLEDHDEYSFEDDPYHADMKDESYNQDHEDSDKPDDYDHDVWADDHSDYDCPEDRARRELESAAKSLEESTKPPSIDDIPLEGTVPEGTVTAHEPPQKLQPTDTPQISEIPTGLETPVRRPTGNVADQDSDPDETGDTKTTPERSA